MKLKTFFICTIFVSLASAYDYEIRTAPVAFFARWITLDASVALTEQFATGPSVIIYASESVGGMFAPSYNGYAIGLHNYFYAKSFSENSLYFGMQGYYEKYKSYPHAYSGHYEITGFKVNLKSGYQFVSRNNFSFLTGFGFEYRNYAVTDIYESIFSSSVTSRNQENFIPYLEFKVGYKF